MPGCTHHEEVNSDDIGTCLLCGQERQYDPEDDNKAPVVIKEGIDFSKCEPLEIPRERKIAIAYYAKKHSIPVAVKCTGLPMKVIRAWMGTYTRVQKEKPGPKPKPREIVVDEHSQLPTIKITASALLLCGFCGEVIEEMQPLYIDISDALATAQPDTTERLRLWFHLKCGQRLAGILDTIGVSCELDLRSVR